MKKYLLLSIIVLSLAFINFSDPDIDLPEKNKVHSETETEAIDALAFLSQLNAYPNAEVESGNYYAAYQQYKNIVANSEQTRGAGWENIGPNNVGGRTVSIAIDPVDTSIIYMGSASGGLWKSVTGGLGINAWQYIKTGFPVLGVGAITINPDNNNEIFIGTGETYAYGTSTNGLITRTERGSFGMGILKTIDGGLTWNISLDWTYQENRGVWDIIYDPQNTNILHAATTEGIYRSTDGGDTWTLQLDKKMVMDLEINNNDPEILYAGVGNLSSIDKGIYKSTNGGDTWNILTGGGLPAYTQDGRISISAYQSNPDILIAVIGNAFSTKGIYKTVNAGTTWVQLDAEEVVSYQGWYAKGILIKPDDSQQVLLCGVELWKSTNGGTSINQITEYTGPYTEMHPDVHNIISNPLNPELVYVITDGGLFRSNDFGETFYSCNDGYVTTQFYIGAMSAQSNAVGLGGLQDNATVRYDGTNYWLKVIGGDGCFTAIDPTDDQIQYGAYQYGNFYKSYDQGLTWFEQIFYPFGSAAFVAPIIIAPSDHDILFVGDTKLNRSDDAGSLFYTPDPATADSGNFLLSIGVSTSTPDTIYYSAAGISGRADIFRCFDGGETKTVITNGLPDRYYRDIEVNKNNAAEVLVCLSGFGSPHVYRSINSGDDWTDISVSLPDVPFHSVLFDPINDSIIYAGNDFSVFVSYDKGNAWSTISESWPDAAMVFDLQVSTSDKKLLAFTHGHGVYRTDLLGIDQPIAIQNSNLNEQINIYPTLVDDKIIININELNIPLNLKIFDMQGNLILDKPINANKSEINCASFSKGNYIIQLIGNGVYYSEKFVKI